MVFASDSGLMSLAEALAEAEKGALKKNRPPVLDTALALALSESEHPVVAESWRSMKESKGGKEDALYPSLSMASLVLEESIQPQAVGHALVQASRGGHILCVRRLREIMNDQLSGSMLLGLFNACALLKAAEAGHEDIVEELLTPLFSASTAMMGYMVATRWKDKDKSGYPFVEPPGNTPSGDWTKKLNNTKAMLPPGGPSFQSGGWDMVGSPGLHENLHEIVRASYSTYLLWRVSVVAASQCHADVFRILLNRRTADNKVLAESLTHMEGSRGAKGGLSSEVKKLVTDRAKMDTLMYQLVEEYSTKNYHDAMLYTLWGHIERGGRDGPGGPGAGKPRCVAQAQNGLWEMQLEVPLLMMPVEHALQDEEPFRRYKQLTLLYTQRAKVNIQLISTVEALPNFIQVTVGVKHVRFKAENSRWDESCIGHFPSLVTLSVMPQTKEGTSVTMTNSSSNIVNKIGRSENLSVGTGAGDGATRGLAGGLRVSAGVTSTSTMKSTPWRFEQLPMTDDRGGSFVWTLQSMKGIPFQRSNPHRMAETNSRWNWARRTPGNPLDELPFTSEGGIIFTGSEFADTMMWRFPKSMEGKRLRWSIEGQIHSTFTTSRYFETRMASFQGDIEERLTALEAKKDKDGAKGDKPEKAEKGDKAEKKEKPDKAEKAKKGEKEEPATTETPSLGKLNTTMKTEFLEWLEFKKYQEEKLKAAQAKAVHADSAVTEPDEPESVVESKPEEASFEDLEHEEDLYPHRGSILQEDPIPHRSLRLAEDDEEVPKFVPRVELVDTQGMWLDSSDLDILSPPHQPHVGGPLRSIYEEDLYTVPDYIVARENSETSRKIEGLSVRSARSRSGEYQR
ncbi:hypothetical protein KC19_4G210300 [Ceratodon purpureus]|uniref:Uncharacterized protein n=1 Tax=Ceratodon purpureus TaxID=3225 RepID=A0A8T0ID51_CERPU|nr:hypothetical protein KC19_4G210300 [Ceratodon purpureus]